MGRQILNKKIVNIHETMDATLVGWKFARLREMYSKELPVPKIFCLTKVFYEDAFASIRSQVKARLDKINFESADDVRKASQDVRKIFLNLEFTDQQKKDVYANFDKLFDKEALVSVRSSTVGIRIEESEDSADNPFAGMSDSFLYVKRDQLFEKIRMCWASGFSYEGMIYRHKQNFDLLGFGVSVGIQEMIFGERSFVMFTCDPNTASKDTVIVAGYGIGEGVVQEKVPVDHYFRNSRSGNIHANIENKVDQLSFDEAKGYGLCSKPVEKELWEKQCLSDDEIHQIAEIGKKIESIFGCPQDIEGTFTADGKPHILQSRPVSLDYRRQRIWSNSNVTESFPGVTTALTFSFAKYFYRVIFYDCYRDFGIDVRKLHDNHEMLDKMIGFINGRVYYNLTSFYNLHAQSPLFPIFSGPWESMMGFLSSYQTKPANGMEQFFNKVKSFFGILGAVNTSIHRYIVHQRDMKRFHEWWEELFLPLRGKTYAKEDPIVSLFEFNRVWIEVGNLWGVTLLNDTLLPMLYSLAEKKFKKWGAENNHALLSDLLCGDEQLTSVEIVLSSVNLAEMARNNPKIKKAFNEKDAKAVWNDIKEGKLDSTFCEAFNKHLYRYGDRGLQELKIEQPSMRQTPWVLVTMIKGYVNSDVTVATIRSKEQEVRDNAEVDLKKLLKGHPLRLFFINKLLKKLRRFIRNRENSRYCRSELYGFSKSIFVGIGEQFTASGIIDSPEDIYHLAMEEIFGYIDGTGVTQNLKALVELRKKEFDDNMKLETPEQITTLGPIYQNVLTIQKDEINDVSVLKGLGSSSGKVRGTAKVLLDPTTATELTDDMILVARETDPGWIFLMLASKGIVVERGSMLSHTAITGRKFGIPTVVSVPNATSIIPDGAQIEIDGASGIVTIL